MKKHLLNLIILLFLCNIVVANDITDPLWIGIVRIDGILVPIGTFREKWINTWPEASIIEQPEVDKLAKTTNGKMKLQDVPEAWKGGVKEIPPKVYLWTRNPDTKDLNVLNAEQYGSHCSYGWAFRTDLHPIENIDYSPTPKVGVATSQKANIVPFEVLSKKSEIPSALFKAINAKFDGKNAIELTRIYKARNKVKTSDLYFIEAQEKGLYPDSDPDSDCHNLNSVNSWVLVCGDKIIFLSSELIETTCGSQSMHEVIPWIVISAQGKYYIVSENYGYEWEFYTIHELLDESIKEVLSVGEGGC